MLKSTLGSTLLYLFVSLNGAIAVERSSVKSLSSCQTTDCGREMPDWETRSVSS